MNSPFVRRYKANIGAVHRPNKRQTIYPQGKIVGNIWGGHPASRERAGESGRNLRLEALEAYAT